MDLKAELQQIVDTKGASVTGLEDGARLMAQAISEALKAKSDEVAIILLTSTRESLKFVWPPALFESLSAFPANHKFAFASGILASLKGKVDNKIAESKHLKFFENVKGMETSGLPIQKMVALPIMNGTTPLGVVEVSRKGKNFQEAGPNFTPQDAQDLVAICKTCAPFLAKLVPDPFL
jgi:hypothetical protein